MSFSKVIRFDVDSDEEGGSFLKRLIKKQAKDEHGEVEAEGILSVNETVEILRSVDNVLSESIGIQYLHSFMKSKSNDELLLFIFDVDKYTYEPSKKKMQRMLHTYLEVGSPNELNFDEELRIEAISRITQSKTADPDVFDDVKAAAVGFLNDIFFEFTMSFEGRRLAYLWKNNRLIGMTASIVRNAQPPPRIPHAWKKSYGNLHRERTIMYIRNNISRFTNQNEDALIFSPTSWGSSSQSSGTNTYDTTTRSDTIVISAEKDAGKAGGTPLLENTMRIIPNYLGNSPIESKDLSIEERTRDLQTFLAHGGMDTVIKIAKHLSLEELLEFSLASKGIQSIIFRSDRLWEALTLEYFHQPLYKLLRYGTVNSFETSFQLFRYLKQFSMRRSRCLTNEETVYLLTSHGNLLSLQKSGNDKAPEIGNYDSFSTTNRCVYVAAGSDCCLALDDTGCVYRWSSFTPTPTKIPYFEKMRQIKITAVAAGERHFHAITSEGEVYSWGSGRHGQLGLGNGMKYSAEPVKIPNLDEPICAIAAGSRHSISLSTMGHVYSWGTNEEGVLGVDGAGLCGDPKLVDCFDDSAVAIVACSFTHCAAVTIDGALHTWGKGHVGQLGYEVLAFGKVQKTPLPVAALTESGKVCNLSLTSTSTVGALLNGSVFVLGNLNGKEGVYSTPLIFRPSMAVKHISSYPFIETGILLIDSNGKVFIAKLKAIVKSKKAGQKHFTEIKDLSVHYILG